ncbi:hypothetical protein [Rhizorhabdus phycosphaerae]|uniref:hypothetical protein n=1 Tax=Rhizorhabdus phycosphaerae TaxID=2711156 RepID=UPI0013EAAC47|nr:hypothetical protein [Rhizorhabdus phycosphaerae]
MILQQESVPSQSEAKGNAPGRPAPRIWLSRCPRWAKDIAIRAFGCLLLSLAVHAIRLLHAILVTVPRSEGTPGHYAIAMFAFLSASLGIGLLLLGYSINDPVEIADRWRPRL